MEETIELSRVVHFKFILSIRNSPLFSLRLVSQFALLNRGLLRNKENR